MIALSTFELTQPEAVHHRRHVHNDEASLATATITTTTNNNTDDAPNAASRRELGLPLRHRVPGLLTALTSRLAIYQWWKHYVDPYLLVQDELGHVVHDPRDFLALERTHLAFVRTSNVLALFGVVVAQMFILNNADSVHGRWLASSAYILAILVALTSAIRTVWLQDKIIVGRTATGGWVFVLCTLLALTLLAAVLVFALRI